VVPDARGARLVSVARPGPPPTRARTLCLGVAGVGVHLAAFPPLSWWPLALLACWPLTLLATEAATPRRAFLRLFVAGLFLFALGSAWMAETTWINLVLVTLVEAPFVGLYGWAARRALPGRALMPVMPLLWVGHEMLRTYVPLSGYPWQLLGQSLAANPLLVQAADLGGVPLLSFVAASAAALLVCGVRRERRAALAAGVVVALAVVYGALRPATLGEATPGPRLAAIQPGFPQRLKEDNARAKERYARCMELSLDALRAGPATDLLVWPETMWPYAVHDDEDAQLRRDLRPVLAVALGERAAHLLLGAVAQWERPQGGLATANSALYLDEQGRRLYRYDKHILVPGGEAIPFSAWLPARLKASVRDWIASIAGFVVDLTPGPGPSLVTLDGTPFGITICYENAYGHYGRRSVADGAAFLVNLSNEAWFGTSTEFDHMELQSVLRAVETRRAVFRSTNSGISCLVRPDGRAPQGEDRLAVDGRDRAVAGVFAATVPIHTDRTLYVLIGDAFGWLCLVAAGLLSVVRAGHGTGGRTGGRTGDRDRDRLS
jgi:apolipoprotein N-acyltransferase